MPSLPPASHLCATLTGCHLVDLCPSAQHLAPFGEALSERVRTAGFHVVGEAFHFFAPHAVTGALVLAESHLCFHTWPEYGVVYLDLFTCAHGESAITAMQELVTELAADLFCSTKTNISWHDRNALGSDQTFRSASELSQGAR